MSRWFWLLATLAPAIGFAEPKLFELRVVGPDGEAVSNALVRIRTNNDLLSEDDFRTGRFVDTTKYSTNAECDSEGRLTFLRGDPLHRFNLTVLMPGYGPYWAEWSGYPGHAVVPDSFTMELDNAWSAGGVIVDKAGRPVAGATIRPSLEYKKRPGFERQLGINHPVTSDEYGRWRFDMVPDSKERLFVEISKSGYRPLRVSLDRARYGHDAKSGLSEKLVLDEGLVVRGTVTADDGRAIEGATVSAEFVNNVVEAKTDEDGRYRLSGCEPGETQIVFSAPGKAFDMVVKTITSEMDDVDFVMQPGRKVRIRVLDENGRGVARSRIFFQKWRGRHDYAEFRGVNQYADENGVWEWNEAPVDVFLADICRRGGMQLKDQPIHPGQEEYVFTPDRLLLVELKVTDSVTGEAVSKVRVTPGERREWNEPGEVHWREGDSFEATGSDAQLRFSRPAESHYVRVEAKGYLSSVSRAIQSNEGSIRLKMKLNAAESPRGRVVRADGSAVEKAQIAVVYSTGKLRVSNGRLPDRVQGLQRTSDEKGQFEIPATHENADLVVLHDDGYAHVQVSGTEPIGDVVLERWARLDGAYLVGGMPVRNSILRVSSNGFGQNPFEASNIDATTVLRTDANGRFSCDRMFPGSARIVRETNTFERQDDETATSSVSISHSVELVRGERTQVQLGGSGRTIVGTVVPPESFSGTTVWSRVMVLGRVDVPVMIPPQPPAKIANDADKVNAWRDDWLASEAGLAFVAKSKAIEEMAKDGCHFQAAVDGEGRFRIKDVPPGQYLLRVLSKDWPLLTGQDEFSLTVPEGDAEETIDVGELRP